MGLAERLDIGRDMDRLHLGQGGDPARRHELAELPHRLRVSRPRIRIADRDREEFLEASFGVIAGSGDQGRGLINWDQKRARG